jgi:succinate-semialdehyde dehydrogenase / glutarate-semialdehyde dehydrogenase
MRTLTARNPRTGQRDYSFDVPEPKAIIARAMTMRAAQGRWHAAGFEGRANALRQFADALSARRAEIASALEIDTGRRRIAGLEVDSVVGSIKGWASATPSLLGEEWVQGRMNPALKHRATFVPYSVVGVISPWNFPFLLSMIDTVPALVAGCAVLVKPSEVTPRFAAPVHKAIESVPGLRDIFDIVPGDGETGQAIIDAADCICFTGSVATGRKVAVQAAGRLIPAMLELGGKDPLLVLEGADLEAATDAALRGSVLSTGQACQSIERIYVQRPIYEEFVMRLVEKAKAVRLNAADIHRGELGPIIFDRQADILRTQMADAIAKGATIHTGGDIEDHGGGYFMRPTVLTDVPHDALVMTDETFGPVMPVGIFDTIDQAVAQANDGEFGLSAAVFAATIEDAEAVAVRIEAGAVSLNDAALTAQFYEAAKQSFKASGMGPSRMGADGLTRFYRRRALIAQTGRPVPLSAYSEDA